MNHEAYEALPGGLRIRVQVQPRASRKEVVGIVGGRLKVRLTAPPLEGAANEACRELIAEWLGVPRRTVELDSGLKSRDKTLSIKGDPGLLAARCEAALANLGP